jgi:4-hydroxy-tetrahydrodipicolinate reductase
MKIAIIGYGKMGHEVERVAKIRKHWVVAIIDPIAEGATAKEINLKTLNGAEVALDFTTPQMAPENIKSVAETKTSMVVGTTGWYDHITEMKQVVQHNNIGFIYSPNFSLGVNLFYRMVEASAKLINKAPNYDVYSYELHHNQKADSPSGTAKALGEILTKNIDRKTALVHDKLDRKIMPQEVHVASIRAGWIPGTHIVGFDSEADTIELKHTARSRAGFAYGAVMAAEWLQGKKGFFTINDFMNDVFK